MKVCNIVLSDEDRKVMVVSAPGKRTKDDTKVTDMLYACYASISGKGPVEKLDADLAEIKARYTEIIDGLGLKYSLEDEFKPIRENFINKAGRDQVKTFPFWEPALEYFLREYVGGTNAATLEKVKQKLHP